MDWNLENCVQFLIEILGDYNRDVSIISTRDAGSCIHLNFEINASAGIVLYKLLSSLNEEVEFFFFDNFHPQRSDPGAYVTVLMQKGKLTYYLGNHGWHSDIFGITFDRLHRYALKNTPFNNKLSCMGSFRLSFGLNQKVHESAVEVIAYERLKETSHYIGPHKIYELNGSYLAILDETKYSKELIANTEISRYFQSAFYLNEAIHEGLKLNGIINEIGPDIFDESIKVKIRYREPIL